MSYPVAVLLSLWAAAAVAYDWRYRRLPNGLTLGGAGAGLAYLLMFGQGITGASWQSCLTACGAALILLLPAYAYRVLGAGDVKFTMAIGVLGGGSVLFSTMVAGSILLGGMALWSLARAGRFLHVSMALQQLGIRLPAPDERERPRRHLPFGAAHGIAFIAALWTELAF